MTPEESEQFAFAGTAFFQNISVMIFGIGLFDIAGNLVQVEFALVVSLQGGLTVQEMAAGLKLLIQLLFGELGHCINIADAIVGKVSLNNSLTFDWVAVALNLIVNIVATLLIAHRAWTHHQSTCAILGSKKTRVEAILLLMVETGALFGTVQASSIILKILDIHTANLSPVEDAHFFLNALYIYSAALNPVALVILIQTGNTYEHSFHMENDPSLEINSVPNV
ncbi:hypothetical protein BT96DRAFT_1069344 [Gymnopus androsaceus JB14]|uniref:Uncharacterized protein n=1 Tax=Gymnopus androsaceus JB14 TaxID=1447944 RepID=A0A6A4GVU5_9AGAR|nr:hypothetical protein BT96DRAFT_1069344 [Gymnopus androsaceus JB14]